MKGLILVDFDNTLTSNDTTRALLISLLKSKPLSCLRVFSYCMKMKKSGGSDIQLWKNQAIGELICGMFCDKILESLNLYRRIVKRYIRSDILSRLLMYAKEGKEVIIVSASPRFAVSHCLSEYPFSVIGTEFMVENNLFFRKTLDPICFGEGKIHWISKWVNENLTEPFTYLESWSDELSDLPMMQLSQKKFWVCTEKKKKDLKACFPDAEYFLC